MQKRRTFGLAETFESERIWWRWTTWSRPLSPTIMKIDRWLVWTVFRISVGIRESRAFFGISLNCSFTLYFELFSANEEVRSKVSRWGKMKILDRHSPLLVPSWTCGCPTGMVKGRLIGFHDFSLSKFHKHLAMEDQGALSKPSKATDIHPCLSSKKALKALHSKCLEYIAERNVSYLDQSDVKFLLDDSNPVKPNVVADIMNQMVAQVLNHDYCADGRIWFSCWWLQKANCWLSPLKRTRESSNSLFKSLLTLSLTSLTKDEHLVYTRIQQADNQGIWSQNLSRSLNMGKVVLDKCLRSLESRRIIKKVKSVKVLHLLYSGWS